MTPVDIRLLLPVLVIVMAACICIAGCSFFRKSIVWGIWSLLALTAAAGCLAWNSSIPLAPAEAQTSDSQADSVDDLREAADVADPDGADRTSDIIWDRLSAMIAWIGLGVGLLLVLVVMAARQLHRAATYMGILLLSVAGAVLTGMAGDLAALYLSVEMAWLPLCALVWMSRSADCAHEASIKYALMSFLSSGLLLLGFVLLFGLTGSSNLHDITRILESHQTLAEPQLAGEASPVLALMSLVLIFAGLGFRLIVIPFHFGMNEIFAGASNETAMSLAVVPRLAAFTAFLRLLVFTMAGLEETGTLLAFVVAGLTMAIGAALALRQTKVRATLYYVVLAQGGLVMAGLAVAFQDAARATISPSVGAELPGGASAALFVLATELMATIGLFGLLVYLSRPGESIEYPEQLSGLARSEPVAAVCVSALLLSLIGVPPLCGFWGRLNILMSMLALSGDTAGSLESGPNTGFWLLALVTVCSLLATAAVVLRLVIRICFEGQVARPRPGGGQSALAALVVAATFSVACGIWPRAVLNTLDSLQTSFHESRTPRANQPPSGGAGGGRRHTTDADGDLNSIATSSRMVKSSSQTSKSTTTTRGK